MPRRPRIHLAGGPLHSVQRGHNRETFFCGEDDYLAYRHGLGEALKESGCALHAYVLMSNPVRVLLTPPQPQDIPRLIISLKILAQITTDLNTTLQTNQDDLALVLLQKKNTVEAELASVQQEMAQAKADADDAKASLTAVMSEIKNLRTEKDRMLAKVKSADARLHIQSQLDGLSVEAEVKALDNVRAHIKTKIAEADLGKELRDSDLDHRLAAVRQQSGLTTAKAQLEALKAARAQEAEAARRTM